MNAITNRDFLCRQSALVLILLIYSASAIADVKLLDSFPPKNAKLGKSVTDVRLWFDQEPDSERSELILVREDKSGQNIPVVAVHSMGENDLMGFIQQPTPPGRYRLLWSAVTLNGDEHGRGEIAFIVVGSQSAP